MTMLSATIECFTTDCDEHIAAEPGNYYCEACIAQQLTEHVAERHAFETYHRFADSIARRAHEKGTP